MHFEFYDLSGICLHARGSTSWKYSYFFFRSVTWLQEFIELQIRSSMEKKTLVKESKIVNYWVILRVNNQNHSSEVFTEFSLRKGEKSWKFWRIDHEQFSICRARTICNLKIEIRGLEVTLSMVPFNYNTSTFEKQQKKQENIPHSS